MSGDIRSAESVLETFADVYGAKNKWKKISQSDLKKHPELVDELFKLLSIAYSSIGGHAKIKTPSSLVGGDITVLTAIDIDADPEADAASFGKKKGPGIKSVGIGHDGTRAAKIKVLDYKGKLLKSGKQYAEMSGAIAHIMLTKYGVGSVNDQKSVERVLGKKVDWIGAHPQGKYPENNGWYKRSIGGDPHTKILLGLPLKKSPKKREESAAGRSHARSSVHGKDMRVNADRMWSGRTKRRRSDREQDDGSRVKEPFVTEDKSKIGVIRFTRLASDENIQEVFLVDREGTFYVLRWGTNGSLSFGVEAGGTKSEMTTLFNRSVDNISKGTRLHHLPYDVVSTKADSDAVQHLKIFEHPLFGVDWKKVSGATSAGDEFLKMLRKQIRNWKGSSNGLPVTKHSEWKAFHEKLVAAVRKKYGSKIVIYRGLWGTQAKEAIRGNGLPIKRYSSWSPDKIAARSYQGPRGSIWAVVKMVVKPDDILMAPVTIPDFADPDILHPLSTDVHHSGDEVVIRWPSKTIPSGRLVVVLKSRSAKARSVAERLVPLAIFLERRKTSGFGVDMLIPMGIRGVGTSPSASGDPHGRGRFRFHVPVGKAKVVAADPLSKPKRGKKKRPRRT